MFDDYSKIEDYLEGKLSDADKTAFESKLASDNELQKVVENHSLYNVIADEIINDELSKKIKKKQALLKAKKKPFPIYGYFLLFAAAVAIGFLIPKLLKKTTKGEKIFAAVYTPPMGSSVRGEEGLETGKIKPCFLGHQQLENGKVEQAESSFKASLNDSDLMCKEKSLYYLALINVKRNNFDKAQDYISKVLEGEDGGYEQKANYLLMQLN